MTRQNELYRDGFCVIGIKDDSNGGFYADISLMYIEFSAAVALFLADKLEMNERHGYRLIDMLVRRRASQQKGLGLSREVCIYDNYDMWGSYAEAAACVLGETYTEDDLFRVITKYDADHWAEVFEDLKTFFGSDNTWLISGIITRWDGKYKYEAVFEDFEEVYSRVTKDCDFIRITDQAWDLCIICSHHDGTNSFVIRKMTDTGIEYYYRWLTDESYQESKGTMYCRLKQKYTEPVYFVRTVYPHLWVEEATVS